ncbi:cytidine deaminase [Acidobacteria bacterium Mor1]|nr:cytidine deaminase [Acidobacteria bacterium Mor1]
MDELIELATKARKSAYAPYSSFAVGASVLTEKGVYSGCNVENASLGGTVCAERVALFKAVSEGSRRLLAVAIVANTTTPCPPCGFCRQVMVEFGPSCSVVMANLDGSRKIMQLDELLPESFSPSLIKDDRTDA